MSSKVQSSAVHSDWIAGHGGRIFVRIWSPDTLNDRAPIILLHDSLGSVELWRNFPGALCKATGRKVVAYDRLGFGKSDEHLGKLALDFISSEAEANFFAVRQALGISKFILFGHSVGGGMAVHCAARFLDDCVALVTESAQAFVEDKTVHGIEEAREAFKDANQVQRLERYHGAKTRWVLDAWIGSWLHPDFAAWSLRTTLPNVKCPTLIIHGVNDEYGSPKHPALIAELVGETAQIQMMVDTHHVPHREKEPEVLEITSSFLRTLA